MNPRTSHRRTFRRIHVLPSLLTLGNFSCGFISIVLCLNALFFATRAQLMEERMPEAAKTVALPVPPTASGVSVPLEKERRHAIAMGSVSGNKARAGYLFHWACVIIFFGMMFDVLDGKVARAMGASTAFGTELDSLADVTSFGIAPAIIVNTISLAVMPATYAWWTQVIIFGVIFAICTVLRLARYNIQSGVADKNIFSGLPSPAAAGCVVSAVLFFEGDYQWLDAICSWFSGNTFIGLDVAQVKARLLSFFQLVPGLLMVTTIPFSHLANRYLSGKKSFSILVIAVLLIALIWYEPRLMLFLCFNGYLAIGLFAAARNKLRGKPATVNYGSGNEADAAEPLDGTGANKH